MEVRWPKGSRIFETRVPSCESVQRLPVAVSIRTSLPVESYWYLSPSGSVSVQVPLPFFVRALRQGPGALYLPEPSLLP